MAGPTEFSLESVRQFMLANEGKVTNHDLVKHFRAWLTHPTERDVSRQQLKEFVNTLATIRQENGEKYLVLKKKFYPFFADYDDPPVAANGGRQATGTSQSRTASSLTEYSSQEEAGPSLLDEVMASYQPISATLSSSSTSFMRPMQPTPRRMLPPTPALHAPRPGPRIPPPYRCPPPQVVANPHFRPPPPPPPTCSTLYRPLPLSMSPTDFGLPLPSDYGLPAPRLGLFHAPTSSSPPPDSSGSLGHLPSPPPLPPPRESGSHGGAQAPVLPVSPPPPLLPKNGSTSSLSRSSSNLSVNYSMPPPPIPARNSLAGSTSSMGSSGGGHRAVSRQSSNEDKENANLPSVQDAVASSQDNLAAVSKSNEKISVKERTKTFNRMASEVELKSGKPVSLSAAIKRRNSRATERRGSSSVRDDDLSSISTMDPTAKQWMIRAAQGEYHGLVKMLRDDPRLAKHRDFTSGYTALHWAAKKGHLDMVKLLAGNYSAPVNVKSHGGYTPLHLACMFGHQEVFSLMVKAYGADPHIRDNSGKKPRQYMMGLDQASGPLSLSNDTFRQLKDRRRNRSRQNSDKNSGILRFGSLSVKVKKTTEAFNNYFGSARSTSSDSLSLPYLNTSGNTDEDSSRMPPPKFAPIKKRKSKRPVDYTSVKSAPVTPTDKSPDKDQVSDSDSDYGFNAQQWTNNK